MMRIDAIRAKWLILIGLDGAMPSMVKRFADEGCIPSPAQSEGAVVQDLMVVEE